MPSDSIVGGTTSVGVGIVVVVAVAEGRGETVAAGAGIRVAVAVASGRGEAVAVGAGVTCGAQDTSKRMQIRYEKNVFFTGSLLDESFYGSGYIASSQMIMLPEELSPISQHVTTTVNITCGG